MSNSILNLQTKKYELKLDNFTGPIDLLCYLIEKNQMDIYQVNISQITDQYVAFIQEQQKMNLEVASEFLVMASNLLLIKSKALLPKETEDEAELTEEELLNRIIEYKKYKEISKVLKEYYENSSIRFFNIPQVIELPKQKIEKNYSSDLLFENYQRLLRNNEEKKNLHYNVVGEHC